MDDALEGSGSVRLRDDVRAFMAAQLRYAKHGVTKSPASVQCDVLLHGSRVVDVFCGAAAPFASSFDRFDLLTDWADAVKRLNNAEPKPTKEDEARLLAEFCIALKTFLELEGGIEGSDLRGVADSEVGDGLRERERMERSKLQARNAAAASLFSSSKQQIAQQAQRIAALEDDMSKLKAMHKAKVLQLESAHRETVRFEVNQALDRTKKAAQFGSDDATALRYDNAALTNKLKLRDAEIDRLKERVAALEAESEQRELVIANLEVALVRVEADKAQRKEDAIRDTVSTTARVDSEIATLNGRIANFAETVMMYAGQIRDMETAHTAQLRRQAATHAAATAELHEMLKAAQASIADRDARLLELEKEYVKLGGKRSARWAAIARSNAAILEATSNVKLTPRPPRPGASGPTVVTPDAWLDESSVDATPAGPTSVPENASLVDFVSPEAMPRAAASPGSPSGLNRAPRVASVASAVHVRRASQARGSVSRPFSASMSAMSAMGGGKSSGTKGAGPSASVRFKMPPGDS